MSRAAPLLDVAVAATLLALALVVGLGALRLGPIAVTRPEDLVVLGALLLAARLVVAPAQIRLARPRAAVAAGIAAYVVLMSFIVVTRHWTLQTHALDLGQYTQIVWMLAQGLPAISTLPGAHVPADAMSAWGDHLSPIFFALVPAQWLAPGATSLLVTQTLALASGAVFVYALARRAAPTAAAAAGLALLYLVNPSLHGINVRDIHPAAFAVPLVLAAAAAFDGKRYAWCALALVAVLACREDAAVAVIGFGAWLALRRRRVALGAAVAAAALALLAADIAWIMPWFRAGEPYAHVALRYTHLGSSFGDVLVTIVARPWRWLPVVLSAPKLAYLVALLAPLGFLPLLAPRALAGAVPALAMNLMSLDPHLYSYRSQYQAFVLPFLVLATLDGYAALRARGPRGGSRWLRPAAAVSLGFVAAFLLTARTANDLAVTRWRPGPEQAAAYSLLARVPSDAPVSANERLVPHLAARRDVYAMPRGLGRALWVIDRDTAAGAVPADRYAVVAREGAWVLWERR